MHCKGGKQAFLAVPCSFQIVSCIAIVHCDRCAVTVQVCAHLPSRQIDQIKEEIRGKTLKELQALLLEEKLKLCGLPWEQQYTVRLSVLNKACCAALRADGRPVVEVPNSFGNQILEGPECHSNDLIIITYPLEKPAPREPPVPVHVAIEDRDDYLM